MYESREVILCSANLDEVTKKFQQTAISEKSLNDLPDILRASNDTFAPQYLMLRENGGNNMISKLSHTTIYVLDQDRALDFYVNKLGAKLHTDAEMGPGMRWLTITFPELAEQEIILMPFEPGMNLSKENAANLSKLVTAGAFGFGVFETNDIHATYEEMKSKGVEFTKTSTKEFYATEAIFKDDSGNWFSLTEKSK